MFSEPVGSAPAAAGSARQHAGAGAGAWGQAGGRAGQQRTGQRDGVGALSRGAHGALLRHTLPRVEGLRLRRGLASRPPCCAPAACWRWRWRCWCWRGRLLLIGARVLQAAAGQVAEERVVVALGAAVLLAGHRLLRCRGLSACSPIVLVLILVSSKLESGPSSSHRCEHQAARQTARDASCKAGSPRRTDRTRAVTTRATRCTYGGCRLVCYDGLCCGVSCEKKQLVCSLHARPHSTRDT